MAENNEILIASELLASVSILEILPTVQQKVEFADRAIKTVIGLNGSGFCVKGYLPSSPMDVACPGCSFKDEKRIDEPFDCPLQKSANLRLIPLSTSETFFGYFIIPGEFAEQIIQYEHLLLNFLTILTISIDNLLKRHDLEKLNVTLHQSEEKFHTLFTQMLDGFALHEVICDEAGKPIDYRFLEMNPAFERMTGLNAERLLGKRVLEVMPKTEKYWIETYGQVALTGNPVSFENYSVELGKYFRVLAFSNKNGQFVTVIEDITERKKAEAEINCKNEELIKLNTEKDKFFSIIAHDLRSPFNSLLGFTELLEKELPTMSRDQIQKIVVTMRKSATNLYALLENLLEWSRLQRGLITFNPEPMLLMPKVLAETAMVIESANEKEIEINYDIPEDLKVYADENMLSGILRNLASNAVKFTPKGGKVTISAKSLDHTVECSLRDTGIGMNRQMKENLFNMDVNTSRKGTEKEPSNGLGLILCNEFVEKHGGKLWVESEEGKGSTFYFTIPYNAV